MHDPLFQPITINSLEIANRIYMPAMHLNMADQGQVTEQIQGFYAHRAQGGAGIICAGYATIDEQSGSSLNIGAHNDDFIPGLSALARTIEENGAKSCLQLNHAGRYNFSFFMDGKQAVAPSALASKLTGERPRALEIHEIQGIVRNFGRAAARVREAGFDAVEILAGTGYLISEFISPVTNLREDEYGGSFANRMRFPLEVLGAVRKQAGADFPLVVRMNGNDLMQGGMSSSDLLEVAQRLASDGLVDALHVNVGWHEGRVPQITASVPRATFAYLARRIKERTEVPVIASHRINDPDGARELVGSGMCDMTAMGRALITDPDLPNKAREGREQDIVHCIGCAQGCFDNIFRLKPVECLCNPRAGHELETDISPSAELRTILVVGGGPGGMSAALAARARGHRVVIWEKSNRLGGQLWLAAAPPGREEFAVLARDLSHQVHAAGVEVILGKEAFAADIAKFGPDEVIVATGAEPVIPDLPGADLSHVVQAWDVLGKKEWPGRRVVVLGGGAVGVESALALARRGTLGGAELKFLLEHRVEDCDYLRKECLHGTHDIVLVEMLERIGQDIGKSTRWTMLQELHQLQVKVKTKTRAVGIEEQAVRVEKDGEQIRIPADSVILALGSRPYNPLQSELEAAGLSCRMVGDAQNVGQAIHAIHTGFAVGRAI
ncbi:FAD-dependent oxidoreductase [Desulfovermiculus halophilus]|uniref:oxidoreductase n=1 Tax=Desulfovermiculus halophilus TaxID=339722 RepID=UPI000482C5ED|nr:FAD-dependent oxidoreductase [Desulfovermiculus halophilus]